MTSDTFSRETCNPRHGLVASRSNPTENVFVYMDNSNIWIEAKKLLGSRGKEDPGIRIDVGKVLNVLAQAKGRNVAAAKLYGSEPPPVDTVWKKAKERGWEVCVNERSKSTGKEKGVDTQLVADAIADAYECHPPRTMIFISGDADIIPAINIALKKNWKVEVYMWRHALSSEFKKLNGCVVECLDDYKDRIIFHDGMKFPIATNKELLSKVRAKGVVCRVIPGRFTDTTLTGKWQSEFKKRFDVHFKFFWFEDLDKSVKNRLVLVFEEDTSSNKIADIIGAHQQRKITGVEEMQPYLQFEQELKKQGAIENPPNEKISLALELDESDDDDFHSVLSEPECQSPEAIETGKENGNDAMGYANGMADDDDDGSEWQIVRRKKKRKKKKQLYSKSCENGIYCFAGSKCKYKHLEYEKEYFHSNNGHGKPPIKSKLCNKHPQCPKRDKECKYAHGEQDAHCFKCNESGHFPVKCDRQPNDSKESRV